MTEGLGSSISQSQLTLSLFMLGVACGQIIFGPLSDQFGRLPVIRVGTLTYIAFSLLSSLAWNIEYMWLARIAQGAAAASGAVIARALIRDRFEGDRAAQMMALTGAAMASVPLIAPTLGAYITVEFGWRFTFVAQSVFAVLVYLGLSSLQSQSSGPRSEQGQSHFERYCDLFQGLPWKPQVLGLSNCWNTVVLRPVYLSFDSLLFSKRRLSSPNRILWPCLCHDCNWICYWQLAEFSIGDEVGTR